jgi:hypothetical protein
VLRSEKNTAFPPSEHQHHWEEGLVEEVSETVMIVALKSESSKGLRNSFRKTSVVSQEPQLEVVKKIRLPLAGRTSLASEILNVARQGLRCINWTNITLELMASSTCLPEHKSLARRPRSGERIDYFMSHSWPRSSFCRPRMMPTPRASIILYM